MSEPVPNAPVGLKPPTEKIAWVNRNLRVGFPGLPPPAPPPPTGRQVTYGGLQKSRVAWIELRNDLQSQLQNLELAITNTIQAHNQDQASEDMFDPAEVAAGAKGMYAITSKLDQTLADLLEKAMATQGPDRPKLLQQARALLAEYRTYAASDPLVVAIDKNGFMPTSIKPAIDYALKVISESL